MSDRRIREAARPTKLHETNFEIPINGPSSPGSSSKSHIFRESIGCPESGCKIVGGHIHMDRVKDVVNHPAHYTAYQGVEIIEIAEKMNFNLGNAVKYIARAGLKNPEKEIEDLEKARWYLDREIGNREQSVVEHVMRDYTQPPLEKVRTLIEQMSYNRGRAISLMCAFIDRGIDQDLDELRLALEVLDRELALVRARS